MRVHAIKKIIIMQASMTHGSFIIPLSYVSTNPCDLVTTMASNHMDVVK